MSQQWNITQQLAFEMHESPLTTAEAIAGPAPLLNDDDIVDMPSGLLLVITVFWSPVAIPAAMAPFGATSTMPMAGPGPAEITEPLSGLHMEPTGGCEAWLAASAMHHG